MLARPFLQNMDDHNLRIVIYITNRFNWGIWGFEDRDYYDLYANMSNHPRVTFIADNCYDQYYASLYNIMFKYIHTIRLYPDIQLNPYLPITNKLFIYNRGSKINDYKHLLEDIPYDIYGENYDRYKDENHITEYIGYLHLPYQTNIHSLWENIGNAIIYFIPSKQFIKHLINTTSWYYWEEKNKPFELLDISIDLSEWYNNDNIDYFIYFESWEDLRNKYDEYKEDFFNNKSKIISKKKSILKNIKKSNTKSIYNWERILEL